MTVYRSHDRALPEIPASASGVASTDDDEEEDEGHYDIISKNRRAAAVADLPPNGRAHKPRFCHPYEIVAGDLDSTYAGIREELEAVISHRNSTVRPNNSRTAAAAAVAREISDPLYAGIKDDSDAGTHTSAPVLLSGITSTYSTVINNPQAMRLHVSDHVVEPDGTVSVGMRGDGDAESPLLPPRNGNFDAIDDGVTPMSVSLVANAWPALTATVSALSAGTANGPHSATMSAVVHVDPSMHMQEQLLHNDANADAMPVSGTAIASWCFVKIPLCSCMLLIFQVWFSAG